MDLFDVRAIRAYRSWSMRGVIVGSGNETESASVDSRGDAEPTLERTAKHIFVDVAHGSPHVRNTDATSG